MYVAINNPTGNDICYKEAVSLRKVYVEVCTDVYQNLLFYDFNEQPNREYF